MTAGSWKCTNTCCGTIRRRTKKKRGKIGVPCLWRRVWIKERLKHTTGVGRGPSIATALRVLRVPRHPLLLCSNTPGLFPAGPFIFGGVETEETAIKSINGVSSRRKSEKCQVVTRPPLNTNAHLHLLRFFAAYPTRPMSCRNARSVVISNDFCCCTARMTIEYAR